MDKTSISGLDNDKDYYARVVAVKDGVEIGVSSEMRIYAGFADKFKLDALYNTYKDTEKGNYTDASWEDFTDALTAAKAVLENPDVTQKQVDDAYAALEQAAAGLTEKDASAPEDSGGSSSDAGGTSSPDTARPKTDTDTIQPQTGNHPPFVMFIILCMSILGICLAKKAKELAIFVC